MRRVLIGHKVFFLKGRGKDFLGKEGFSWEGGFQKEGGFDE